MDQGHNYESDLLKELCELAKIKKIRMSGYHPLTNGQTFQCYSNQYVRYIARETK